MSDWEKYQANESLLQSYRNIFISSQAFLLAVGALLISTLPEIFIVIAGISFVMIWYIWYRVVRSRHLIVDYYKYASKLLDESVRAKICTEEEYVHENAKRKETNIIFGLDTNWRPTRCKLDRYLPILYTVIWVLLIIGQVYLSLTQK